MNRPTNVYDIYYDGYAVIWKDVTFLLRLLPVFLKGLLRRIIWGRGVLKQLYNKLLLWVSNFSVVYVCIY